MTAVKIESVLAVHRHIYMEHAKHKRTFSLTGQIRVPGFSMPSGRGEGSMQSPKTWNEV